MRPRTGSPAVAFGYGGQARRSCHRLGLWRRRREAGFSLLEALLAAAILAGAVLLVSQGFALGTKAASLGGQYTKGVLLAESRLAELSVEPNLGVVETEGDFEDAGLPEARWAFTSEDTETTGLVRLTVTVSWCGAWGERQVTLSALCPEFDQLPMPTGGGTGEGGSR